MRQFTKLFLVWGIAALILVAQALGGGFVSLEFNGPATDDSIMVSITFMDTTVYPQVIDPDTLWVLVFNPDETIKDSLFWANGGTSSANLHRIRPGYFVGRLKAANGSSDQGYYLVYAAAMLGNDGGSPAAGIIRGHCAASYYVAPQSERDYLENIEAYADNLPTIEMKIDAIGVMADSTLDLQTMVAIVTGTCDGCVKVYSPDDGTPNKDGYSVYLGGVEMVQVTYGHSNALDVLDSTETQKLY